MFYLVLQTSVFRISIYCILQGNGPITVLPPTSKSKTVAPAGLHTHIYIIYMHMTVLYIYNCSTKIFLGFPESSLPCRHVPRLKLCSQVAALNVAMSDVLMYSLLLYVAICALRDIQRAMIFALSCFRPSHHDFISPKCGGKANGSPVSSRTSKKTLDMNQVEDLSFVYQSQSSRTNKACYWGILRVLS